MNAVKSLIALVAGVCLAGAAAAQSGQQTTPATPSTGQAAPRADADRAADKAAQLAKSDADFLKQAAQNGHAELKASQLAQTKATSADVKSFAAKMVAEHEKAHQELSALAAAKGVALPDEPSLMQRAKLKLLEGADGEKFDKRYSESFGVKAHQDTVKLFQDAADKAKDAEVKAFAQKTLPTLQEHLTMARTLEASVDPAAAGRADKADKMDKAKADKSGDKKY